MCIRFHFSMAWLVGVDVDVVAVAPTVNIDVHTVRHHAYNVACNGYLPDCLSESNAYDQMRMERVSVVWRWLTRIYCIAGIDVMQCIHHMHKQKYKPLFIFIIDKVALDVYMDMEALNCSKRHWHGCILNKHFPFVFAYFCCFGMVYKIVKL